MYPFLSLTRPIASLNGDEHISFVDPKGIRNLGFHDFPAPDLYGGEQPFYRISQGTPAGPGTAGRDAVCRCRGYPGVVYQMVGVAAVDARIRISYDSRRTRLHWESQSNTASMPGS